MLAVKITDVPAHIVVPVLVDTLTVGINWALTVKADEAFVVGVIPSTGIVVLAVPIEIL